MANQNIEQAIEIIQKLQWIMGYSLSELKEDQKIKEVHIPVFLIKQIKEFNIAQLIEEQTLNQVFTHKQ